MHMEQMKILKEAEFKQLISLFLENPSQENYNTITADEKERSLVLSLVYLKLKDKTQLTQYFEDTFEFYVEIYPLTHWTLQDYVLEKLSAIEKTYVEWVKIYLSKEAELKHLAFMKIEEQRKKAEITFQDMLKSYLDIPNTSPIDPLKKIVLNDIKKHFENSWFLF